MKQIRKVVLYSVGLLGGSFGAALKQGGFTGEIVGLSSERNIGPALEAGAIDRGASYDAAAAEIADADLLVLCSPINAIIETLAKVATFALPEGLLITDVGSTKSAIVDQAEAVLPAHVTFIGGHPMAGSEKSGAAASDPFLFQNAVWVLTQTAATDATLLREFGNFLEARTGCRATLLEPTIHDTITATVSHVPHIVAVAMVNVASKIEAEIPGALGLAAGGFKSLTRIAASPYYMWHDIYHTNRDANEAILKRFIDELQEMFDDLHNEELEPSFTHAAEVRGSLGTNQKGFLCPLTQILVVAEDRPGFLARMTGLISDTGLNIRDIELLKVREGEAGTFMLGFQSVEDGARAVDLLSGNGFSARIL